MATRILKTASLFLLLATLTGCPGGDDDCFDYGSTTRVDNLLKLTPLQTTYNQGQIVTFKILVPATNSYFGEELNLFEKTNDFEAFILTSYSSLFTNNEVTFIKGSQGNEINWFNVPYNNITNIYEFEVNIKLNRIGLYVLYTNDYLLFQGSTKCNRYRLDTNIEGWNSDGKIEFTVQ